MLTPETKLLATTDPRSTGETTDSGSFRADAGVGDPASRSAPAAGAEAVPATPALADTLVADELLVEEISIDGMCGVY
jgi:mycofactocin precursor